MIGLDSSPATLFVASRPTDAPRLVLAEVEALPAEIPVVVTDKSVPALAPVERPLFPHRPAGAPRFAFLD